MSNDSNDKPEEYSGQIEGDFNEPIPTRLRMLAKNIDEAHQIAIEQLVKFLVERDALPTTRSHTKNCLTDLMDNMKKKYECTVTSGAFLACLGVLLSIISYNQNEIFSVSRDVWKGVFIFQNLGGIPPASAGRFNKGCHPRA